MFSWVCSRCGHEVPPSKTECPFCFPAPTESAPAQAPPPQQYQPPPPPPQQQAPPPPPQQQPGAPQYPPPPPQYGQQPPPQYWQPQPPPQYMPPPAQPQYWQPQGTYQMPGQPYPQNPYPPQQPQYAPPPPPEPQQYQPPPPPPDPAPQQYAPPPPPQYQPPIMADARKAEPTPWPAPEEREGKPMWMVAALTIAGFLAVFGIAYFVMGSHGSSTAKDAAAKDAPANPLTKYIEVDGIRLVNQGRDVKFFVVNHGVSDMSDLAVKVTLWASTQRSEEDSVGSFTFHVDTLPSNDAKEMSASLKSDKQSYELPDDWRNMTADVQITGGQ